MISEIALHNFLSFRERCIFPLGNLNIMIGANGSGKSNFLDAFAFLKSCTIPERANGSTSRVLSKGGGTKAWIHQGAEAASVATWFGDTQNNVSHYLQFCDEGRQFRILEEIINQYQNGKNHVSYTLNNGTPIIDNQKKMSVTDFDRHTSILAQRTDAEFYPMNYAVANNYKQIMLYRSWEFGRDSVLRQPQRTDLQNYTLEEDYSNFCLVLSRLFEHPPVKSKIIEAFAEVYVGITDIHIGIGGANAELFIFEGDKSIPAIRLSDGTLRYLVLVTLLLDPDPPALICLEEPELGLHPDLIGNIAKLLKDAATRTQLIVTTHSERIVNAFADSPEAIVVCEKEEGATTLKRLELEDLNEWLEHYSLGELWLRGQIGGVRW